MLQGLNLAIFQSGNSLIIENFDITDTDVIESIIPFLLIHPEITHVNLSGNQISEFGTRAFLNIPHISLKLNPISELPRNTNLVQLNNNNRDLELDEVNEGEEEPPRKRAKFELQECSNQEDKITLVHIDSMKLEDNVRDNCLDLSMTQCTCNDIIFKVIPFLNLHPEISSLNLWGNEIRDEGILALAKISTIKTANLGNNLFGIEGINALADNTTLTDLYLGQNELDIESIKALANNTTLTSLSLYKCKYINADVDAVAKILAENKTLQTLCLQGELSNSGLLALAQNTTLRTLEIRIGNELNTSEGLNALLEKNELHHLKIKTRFNHPLTNVETIAGAKIKRVTLKGFPTSLKACEIWASNPYLEELTLVPAAIEINGLKAIVASKTLQSFCLKYRLESNIAIEFIAAVKIKNLSLHWVTISEEISKLLASNYSLKSLTLKSCTIEGDCYEILANSEKLETICLENDVDYSLENIATFAENPFFKSITLSNLEPEEEELFLEKDPVKRSNLGRKLEIINSSKVPSLQQLSLFALNKKGINEEERQRINQMQLVKETIENEKRTCLITYTM